MPRAASRSAKLAPTEFKAGQPNLSSVSMDPIQVLWVCPFLRPLHCCARLASTSNAYEPPPTLSAFAAPRGGGPARTDTYELPPRSLRSLPPVGAVSTLGAARRVLT